MASKAAPTCNHVKTNGRFCGSPALAGDEYCYYHRSARERTKRQLRHARQQKPLQLPLLEDRESIQIAIGDVLNAILADRIDSRKAGLLLYGLQTASSNAHKLHFHLSQFDDDRLEEYTEYERTTLEKEIEAEIAQEAAAQGGKDREAAEATAAVAAITVTDDAPPKKKPAQRVDRETFWDTVGGVVMNDVREARDQLLKKKR